MLKVGGIWVSSVEVESTLISHPTVLECAVVGKTDQSNLVKPQAFIILNENYSGSEKLVNKLLHTAKKKWQPTNTYAGSSLLMNCPRQPPAKFNALSYEDRHSAYLVPCSPGNDQSDAPRRAKRRAFG
ncbi:MAG: hypothetical protein GY805_23005 [Chloroflexi bacterium]|nr:hypothetical protein [Chloroflexota bacterium]